MSEKKYLVCPRMITSKNDNDRHYISAPRLMELYGVSPSECLVMPDYHPNSPEWHQYERGDFDDLIRLSPRYNGDYVLPHTPAGEGEGDG